MLLKDVRVLKQSAHARLKAIDLTPPRSISLGIGIRESADFVLAVRIRTLREDPDLRKEIVARLADIVSSADLDIRHTGPVRALRQNGPAAARDKVLTSGSSISHTATRGGTLGFFATSRLTGDKGIVSANHVIGRQDLADPGDGIIHPALVDGGDPAIDIVAQFVRSVPLGGAGEKRVDASFAKLLAGTNFDPSLLRDGTRLASSISAGESLDVLKFGRKSKLRSGRVTSFDYDPFEVLFYRSGLGVVLFEDQIEVESAETARPFARDGDSGSLVYDSNRRAVGLLFAHADGDGSNGTGLSYVNPMRFVLRELKVDLLT